MTTLDGLLVIDKPGGLTSRTAVDRAQRWFPRGTRIGHTGTLDPLATGVLVLTLGWATRLAEYVQRMGKTYHAGVLLGARSDTDDADGQVTPVSGAWPPARAEVDACLAGFVGVIEQVPPAYSAAKVTGRRAYDLARQGHEVELRAKTVRIDRIDVLSYAYPRLEIEVQCGKGTYIRSLARDVGERLGCGGLIAMLRRTRVGPFTAAAGLSLEATAEEARARLLPMRVALADLPTVTLDAADARALRQGRAVAWRDRVGGPGGEVAVLDDAGRLIAVATLDVDRGRLAPDKVVSS